MSKFKKFVPKLIHLPMANVSFDTNPCFWGILWGAMGEVRKNLFFSYIIECEILCCNPSKKPRPNFCQMWVLILSSSSIFQTWFWTSLQIQLEQSFYKISRKNNSSIPTWLEMERKEWQMWVLTPTSDFFWWYRKFYRI